MHDVPGFKLEDYGLKQVRSVVFQGMIYINCDPQAADFAALKILRHSWGPMISPTPKLQWPRPIELMPIGSSVWRTIWSVTTVPVHKELRQVTYASGWRTS